MNEVLEDRAPRLLREKWSPDKHPMLKNGDYVIASKYKDGDPGDQFCIGFYDSSFEHFGEVRHLVVDDKGNQFRRNGFRRVAKIGTRRGEWMVKNIAVIELLRNRYSVWHWCRAPWTELTETCA